MTPADPAPAVFPPPAAVEPVPRAAAGTGAELLARFPPRPACLSWPGTRAGRPGVFARLLAPPFALGNPLSQQQRRLGLRRAGLAGAGRLLESEPDRHASR